MTSTSCCTRTKCSNATAVSLSTRSPSKENGHHGTVWTKLLRSYVFLYHNVLQAGVAGVFSALHQMWKAWCKQEKKVLVHGFMQRAPRLVGCSRENASLDVFGQICKRWLQLYPQIKRCFFVRNMNPHPFHAPDFPFLFFFRGPNQMRGQQESSARRHPSCTCCWRRAGESCAQ